MDVTTTAQQALHTAVHQGPEQASGLLAEIALGQDHGAQALARFQATARVWVGMCAQEVTPAGWDPEQLHARFPQGHSPHTAARGAVHVHNAGLSGRWEEADQVLDQAHHADQLPETIMQLLGACTQTMHRVTPTATR